VTKSAVDSELSDIATLGSREFLHRLQDGQLSRRCFTRILARAGLAMATVPLIRRGALADEDLLYFTWEGYDDPGFHPKYVEKHGKSPASAIFADEQEALTKVRAGFAPDIMHPCADTAGRWRDAGVLQPIDTSRLANWGDIFDNLKTLGGNGAEGREWFVPVDWGNTSVLYRSDLVEIEEESWALLWDSRYAGRLSIGEDVTNTAVITALLVGAKNPFDMTDEEIERCKAKLQEQKPLLRFYWSDNTTMEQALASGEIVATSAYNYSAATLQDQGVAVKYGNPKEGVISYCCGLVMGKHAAHVDLAYDLMDAMTDPSAGQWLIESQGYGHSNRKSFELVSEETLRKRGLPKDPAEMFASSLLLQPNRRLDELQVMFETVRAQ